MKRFGMLLVAIGIGLVASAASADDPACDYNADAVCDGADEAIIMGAQGKRAGDDGFVAAADHDGDGVISLSDVAVFLDLRGN
jgi:hypothetical protein